MREAADADAVVMCRRLSERSRTIRLIRPPQALSRPGVPARRRGRTRCPTRLLDLNLLNVGQEGVVCSHALRGVIGCGSLDFCRRWLTPYWLFRPPPAGRGGGLYRGPAFPNMGWR